MMMSGPLLVSMAEAIRGFRSFMLIKSTVTSTPATFPNSAASRLNSTSEAGTKLTHSRMLSFVPFGKLGAFCAATISGSPPTATAPVIAPAVLRNARRPSLVTPPGCIAMAHPRRAGPCTTPAATSDRLAACTSSLSKRRRSQHRPSIVSSALRAMRRCAPLLVDPHFLHAAPAIDGLVRNQVFHIWPDRVVIQPPAQHRADRRLLELSLDRVNQREALSGVQLQRLPIDQARDLLVAVTGIVPRRPAAVVLVEVGVRVVRLDAGPLYPNLKVAARLQRMPLGRLHLPDGRPNADVLQLIDHEAATSRKSGERARQDLEPQWGLGPEPRLGQEGPRPRLLVGRFAIAGECTDVLIEEPPHSVGRGSHRGSEDRPALVHGVDQRAAVDGATQGEPHLRIIEGRLLGVDDEMIDDARVHRRHHELGHCLPESFRDRLGCLARERRVHPASLERRRRRSSLADDQIPEAG